MIRKVFLRTAFNYDVDGASDDSGLECLDKSLAKQEFAEECDINTIVSRFGIGYEVPTGVKVPLNSYFEDVIDFHGAMNQVVEARESFMLLDAKTRARFGNDPGAFVDFCSERGEDGVFSNIAEMEKLGLAVPKAVPAAPPPVKVEVVSPGSAAPGGAPGPS